MRRFKRLVAVAVFSSACLGATAYALPANPCNWGCTRAYLACMDSGENAAVCAEARERCTESCGG